MVSALDSGSRGLGSRPDGVNRFCSWARHSSLPCHFAPRSINEYQQIVREAWWNAGGDLAMDWQLIGGGGEGIVILFFMLKWNRDKFLLSASICSTMEPRKASFNLVKLFYGQGFLLYPWQNQLLTLVIDTLYIEGLSSESWKTKQKLSKQPIRRTVYIIISQRELKEKTSKLLQEQEKCEWASCNSY